VNARVDLLFIRAAIDYASSISRNH